MGTSSGNDEAGGEERGSGLQNLATYVNSDMVRAVWCVVTGGIVTACAVAAGRHMLTVGTAVPSSMACEWNVS